MPINLTKLVERFSSSGDVETPSAYYLTGLQNPHGVAHLNIIFKAAPLPVREWVATRLDLCANLRAFYAMWNGARLFFDSLSLYGCLPRNQLFDRANPFGVLPFDIVEINSECLPGRAKDNLICIGSYSFDRSLVCIERLSGEIICFEGASFNKQRSAWKSLDSWLNEEIARLSLLFDYNGNQLAPDELTLPSARSIH